MVALPTVTWPALLLLLSALLGGARADTVTWRRCKKPGDSRGRVLDAARDDNATELSLQTCGIKELQLEDFKKTFLPNLTHILLQYNDFERVDPAVFVPVSHVTTELVLTFTKLREMPVFGAHALFPRLLDLELSYNEITAINDNQTFSSCVQLKRLNLQSNNIQYIDSNVFKPLQKLEHLILSYNKITSISGSMFQIKSLELLYLDHNLIEYVSPHAFHGTNLTDMLLMGHNRLSFLPEHFVSDLTALSGRPSFYFDSNPWHCACLLEVFADIKRLGVRHARGIVQDEGRWPACVFLGQRACHRHAPSALRPTSIGTPYTSTHIHLQ